MVIIITIILLALVIWTYPKWSYKEYYRRMKKGTRIPFEGGVLKGDEWDANSDTEKICS